MRFSFIVDTFGFRYIDIVKLISATLYACQVIYATYGYVNHVTQSKRVVRRTQQTDDSTAVGNIIYAVTKQRMNRPLVIHDLIFVSTAPRLIWITDNTNLHIM